MFREALLAQTETDQMCTKERVDQLTVIYLQNEILLSNKKEGTTDTSNIDEFQKYIKLKSWASLMAKQ